MQTIGTNTSTSGESSGKSAGGGPSRGRRPAADLPPLLLGAAVAVAGSGAALALAGADTPLRGPLALFFLVAAPGGAVFHALRGLDPWGRVVAALAAALAVDMLVAQGMLALHVWSVPGGVIAVGVVSCLILLPWVAGLPRGRLTRGQDS